MIEKISDIDWQIIQELQGDIPLVANPYGAVAERIGCDRETVINRLKSMEERGYLRRIGAVLHHRETGFKANGMLVCRVEDERIEKAGTALAGMEEVSHCYRRKAYPRWPYNLYGMIHARCRGEVEETAGRFTKEHAIQDYKILYSTEEIKKTSMNFLSRTDQL